MLKVLDGAFSGPLLVKLLMVTALVPKLSVPAPAFVRSKALAEMAPPTVRLFEFTVTRRFAEIVTVPVPKLRSFVPINMKSLFQF